MNHELHIEAGVSAPHAFSVDGIQAQGEAAVGERRIGPSYQVLSPTERTACV